MSSSLEQERRRLKAFIGDNLHFTSLKNDKIFSIILNYLFFILPNERIESVLQLENYIKTYNRCDLRNEPIPVILPPKQTWPFSMLQFITKNREDNGIDIGCCKNENNHLSSCMAWIRGKVHNICAKCLCTFKYDKDYHGKELHFSLCVDCGMIQCKFCTMKVPFNSYIQHITDDYPSAASKDVAVANRAIEKFIEDQWNQINKVWTIKAEMNVELSKLIRNIEKKRSAPIVVDIISTSAINYMTYADLDEDKYLARKIQDDEDASLALALSMQEEYNRAWNVRAELIPIDIRERERETKRYDDIKVDDKTLLFIPDNSHNIYFLNLENFKWKTLTTHARDRNSFSGAIINDLFILTGGFNLSKMAIYNSTYTFNLRHKTWEDTEPLRQPRYGHATVTCEYDNQVYVLGGAGKDGNLNSVEVYNATTKKWHLAASMKHACSYFAVVGYKNWIYVLGGRCNEVYNVMTNRWTTISPAKYQRINHRAIVINDKILILGGTCLSTGEDILEVEEYDPITGVWRLLHCNLPTPRKNFAIKYCNGCLYVFGGKSSIGAHDCHYINLMSKHLEWFSFTNIMSQEIGAIYAFA